MRHTKNGGVGKMEQEQQEQKGQQLEQNQKEDPMSHMSRTILIGLFGGVFWSLMGYLAYYFNFTEVGPALALNPIALGEWKNEALGQWIGIAVIGLLSIIVAVIYNALLKSIQSMWAGLIYGAVIWGVVFYILNPIFPGLPPVNELELNTIITTICLYVLFGVFVGYSISYDEQEKQERMNYSTQ